MDYDAESARNHGRVCCGFRMGSEIGLHTVYYASEYERLEFTHRASSRDVFAAGAVRAAKWIKVSSSLICVRESEGN